MLADLIIGRSHYRKSIDLHRHAEMHCKPSLFSRLVAFIRRKLEG